MSKDNFFASFCKGLEVAVDTMAEVKANIVTCNLCKKYSTVNSTDIGSAEVRQKMGNYLKLWRCSECVNVHSQDAKEVTRKLNQLQLAEILIKMGSIEKMFDKRN